MNDSIGVSSKKATGSLRIAFLDSWLQRAVDGSGTAAAIGGLGSALITQGHRVTRIAPTSNWPHSLTARRLLYNLYLPALLRQLEYDLIVGFDIDGVLWSGRAVTTPYVCSVKGVIAEELLHEHGNVRRLLWSLSRMERINARRAPAVITTSAYCRAKIVQHYGVAAEKIRIVPEGIDLAPWQQAGEATRDPFTVLCVARQYPRKHVSDLINAFAGVQRAIPRAKLVIIGDGPEHAALQALSHQLGLDGVVRLLGALPDDHEVRD